MAMSSQSFLSLGPDGFHRVAYTDWGDPASRHAVLCVHGLSRNSQDFDRLAAALEPDCRVACMDVVGRGDSDWLEDKGDYTFSTYLTDAAALIEALSAETQVKPALKRFEAARLPVGRRIIERARHLDQRCATRRA